MSTTTTIATTIGTRNQTIGELLLFIGDEPPTKDELAVVAARTLLSVHGQEQSELDDYWLAGRLKFLVQCALEASQDNDDDDSIDGVAYGHAVYQGGMGIWVNDPENTYELPWRSIGVSFTARAFQTSGPDSSTLVRLHWERALGAMTTADEYHGLPSVWAEVTPAGESF